VNIARNSKFNINVNFKKSHDSYIYDNRTQKEYLDFFGMYASLPLGYNHKVFYTDEFKKEILEASTFKVNNCEFASDEAISFDNKFVKFVNDDHYINFHYTCTGALAVESAIKVCIHKTDYRKPNIISFRNSFHGINSIGSFITDRFWPANKKLRGLPQNFSTKLNCDLDEVEEQLKNSFATCILVEPIQCSAGDIHQEKEFFQGLRLLCDKYDVPLIFDEIQVGFGGTGKLWYYQHLNIFPDIVIFGKKTQLSGIMVNKKCSDIFDKDEITRLEVTWDGNILDMIRCKHIIRAYREENIVNSVAKKGQFLVTNLSKIKGLENVRGAGLIIAFDMKDRKTRDDLIKKMYDNQMICNKTGDKSIRLRPNLAISNSEIDSALEIINKACEGIKC
tara:strand:- start:4004 stop:5179 length:1176 start_codon:yes stop_codon:yes gene_type:complete